MKKFQYIAMDVKGSEVEGVIEADSQTDAISMIRAKGLFPTRVQELNPAPTMKSVANSIPKKNPPRTYNSCKASWWPSFGVTTSELSDFARKLATLVDAGLPLLRAMRIMSQQETNRKLRKAIFGMSEAIEGGSTFSEALGMYPDIFDTLCINLVRAGEAGGVLEVVLSRMADYLDKKIEIRNSVISSCLFLTSASFAIAVFIAALGVMASLNPIVIGGVIFILLGGMILKVYRKLSRNRSVAHFARTLGTLMNCGVPVLQALNITRDSSMTRAIAKAVQDVHDAVKEGDNIATPISQYKVFSPTVVSMIDVGEETGALPDMLLRVAELHEREVNFSLNRVNLLHSIILSIAFAVITVLAVMK
jgi:type IV pilus assembly protein PilC